MMGIKEQLDEIKIKSLKLHDIWKEEVEAANEIVKTVERELNQANVRTEVWIDTIGWAKINNEWRLCSAGQGYKALQEYDTSTYLSVIGDIPALLNKIKEQIDKDYKLLTNAEPYIVERRLSLKYRQKHKERYRNVTKEEPWRVDSRHQTCELAEQHIKMDSERICADGKPFIDAWEYNIRKNMGRRKDKI